MMPTSLNVLFGLMFLYSLFEFFLKRAFWRPENSKPIVRGGVLFLILAVGTAGVGGVGLYAALILFIILYISLDLATSHWMRDGRFQLEIFIAKQSALVAGLYILYRVVEPVTVTAWYAALARWIEGQYYAYSWMRDQFPAIAAILVAYFFMIDGGTRIVRGVLKKFPVLLQRAQASMKQAGNEPATARRGEGDRTDQEEKENSGEWIGILERIITLSFVLVDSYTAIAFALTAKSIARFNELNNKDFAEYYLLGTSASVATALLTGILVKFILKTMAG